MKSSHHFMVMLIILVFSYLHGISCDFQRFEQPAKSDGSLSVLVIGDWGRKGHYNQSRLAQQDLDYGLRESHAKWKVVIGHHTIKSAGIHGNTEELVHKVLPILKANEVDLYINGHDHCLEHISSSDSQLQFLTSGGGSKAWRNSYDWSDDADEMKFYYDGQGFMSMQISTSEIDINFYDISGNILHKWSSSKSHFSSI